jgi:hypothetical protein
MSRLLWVALAVAAVACKDKSKTEPAPAVPPPAGSAAAPADATAVAEAPIADAPAGPGCDGWRARKVEHMGMGQIEVSIECAGGQITVTSVTEGARDDEPTTEKKVIQRAAWNTLWKALETANWRKLDPKCPAVDPPPESMSVTELELVISDGTLTKEVKCEGQHVTSVHEAVMNAIGDAAE